MITKNIKNIIVACFVCCGLAATLTSCSDFYDPSTDDELSGDDYISSHTEMYTGFLGILTKVQTIGDKEILLTEPRGELIETTSNSNSELIALYNYEPNLQDNSYADPAGYYEVINTCNDYLARMEKYHSNPNVDETEWKAFVASTMRIKVWTYKTLGEIYGQALWFDHAVEKVTDIHLGDEYQLLSMQQIAEKCLSLLDNGYKGVSLDLEADWVAMLDKANIASPASSPYYYWNSNIPHYPGLVAELTLWKAAYMDAAGQNATVEYKRVADILLEAVNKYINDQNTSGNPGYWIPSSSIAGKYQKFWDNTTPYRQESVTAITYDYQHNQTNTLLHHFSNEFPNKYLLRPSLVGMERHLDNKFNPGGMSSDNNRYRYTFGDREGTNPYIAKFRPKGSTVRPYAYQDDVHIYIYRSMQYHLMIIEALNHLKRFSAMSICLNNGFAAFQPEEFDNPEYEGFTQNWSKTAVWGSRSYAHLGIRGQYGLGTRTVKENMVDLGERATCRFNDMAILDEVMLEFGCEGKVYPWMNRMAVRYNDPSIIADRVCPKYEAVGKDAEIRAKIMAGGFWVPYDLGIK